jgi:putative DNA primase/helicase
MADKAKELGNTIKALRKQASRLNTRAMVENVLTFCKSFLPVLANEMDKDPYLINLSNGTYNAETHSFADHYPDNLLSKKLHFGYHAKADCPAWLDFLTTIFQSETNLIGFIQRAMGYTLTGLPDMQALLFCYGSGGNGKSIFFAVVEMLLSDYYKTIPVELLLTKQKNSTDEYQLANLKGARCVVASEIPQDRKLNESQVKDMTGGDQITARVPCGMPFQYQPTHTLWMFGNHKPVIRGTDHGIWRRIYLIPFTYTVPAEQRKDKGILMKQFKDELPGIFNWAMEGLKQYGQSGLQAPDVVRQATEEYKADSNNFNTFLKERCQTNAVQGFSKTKDIYNSYADWCNEEAEQPIFRNIRQMISFLREQGYKIFEGHGKVAYAQSIRVLPKVVEVPET